jgi:hypothetical protein
MWEDSLHFSLSDIHGIGLGTQYSKTAEATSIQLQNLRFPHVLVSFICHYMYLTGLRTSVWYFKNKTLQSKHRSSFISALRGDVQEI